MKWSDESGNAIVEFVAIGLIAQLLIFGFLIKVGSDFRSQLAAESIARQTLRAMQLNGQQVAADISKQVVEVFGIPIGETNVSVRENCANDGLISVTATVRRSSYVAKGFCL